jgi:membrane dipeptidase
MWCGCDAQWTGRGASVAIDRRQALTLLAALVAAGCTPVTAAHRDAAQRVAEESPSVDLHGHPGMFPSSPLTLDKQVERMNRGKLRASLFAAVADGTVIGRRPQGGLYATRDPRPGESPGYTYRSLGDVRAQVIAGTLSLIQSPADLDAPRPPGRPGAILAVEGGDFLEGRIERVAEAHANGIRSIQLTHYRINELGDIQTEPPRYGGLTPFGLDVIREMNRLGMVVDVAHLTLDGVRGAKAVTRKPLLLSHTVLYTGWARSVSDEHARLVAETGGVIGIFPVNSGGYHGLAGYVDNIQRMIKVVGVDHVGIGTDMDGISPPSFVAFDDYAEWPSVTGALLARGYSRDDVAKVAGGNFVRVFRDVTSP